MTKETNIDSTSNVIYITIEEVLTRRYLWLEKMYSIFQMKSLSRK